MNSEQNLTREEAIAILNTPDEQLNELIERAGACLLYTSPSPRDS